MTGKASGEMPQSQQNSPYPPPLDHNPHDPSHYYRAADGKYYWTPNGSPMQGQPPVADTPGINDTPVTKPDINDKWGHEAGKGYHMTPEGLRNLATALEGDMGELQSVVNSNRADMGAAGAMGTGDWEAAHEFGKLAGKAQSDFSDFYGKVIQTYSEVINRLRTTANNGEQAETDTHNAVKNQSGNSGDPNKKI